MNTRHWIPVSGRTLVSLMCGLVIVAAAHAATLPSPTDSLLAQLSDVPNLRHPYAWLLTGGQPDAAALETLAGTGAWAVMDLRTTEEPRGFDERAAVKSLGLRYLPIPTRAGDFTDARLTAFRHHLIAHGSQHPLFIHCGSGNRVGGAILPWLVLDQGVDEDLALEMARDVGLRDLSITRRALAYIHARQPRTPIQR